jgi:hypothetical protein
MSTDYILNAGTNWKNMKVGVKIFTSKGAGIGGIELQIPSRIMIRESVTYDIIDGINAYNQGVVAKPHRYTFAVTVPTNVDTVRLLRQLLSDEEPFIFELIDIDPKADTVGAVTDNNNTGDFRLLGERLVDCYLTDKEITVETSALPYAVFNGIALRYNPKVFIASTHTLSWLTDVSKTLYGNSNIADMNTQAISSILDDWTAPHGAPAAPPP